jgi:MoxR-like ATPase
MLGRFSEGDLVTTPVPVSSSVPSPPAAPPGELLERVLFEVKRVVVGQDRMLERAMVCLLARGHCLIEGVPGLAKTLTVETLARCVRGSFVRIQFTPDLVPADIVGTLVYRPSQETFDVALGPVFANFVLADEINRAPAKVQSALLEVMSERQVSIGGTTHAAPDPFLVLATQNPIESDGVYPLPEAQRDRFLLKILVPYPSPTEELEIVKRMGVDPPSANPVLKKAELRTLQRATDQIFVDHAIVEYAVRLVLATRDPSEFGLDDLAPVLEYGASPRASLGLVAAARALALLRGREYVLPDDVSEIAPDVLRHRLVLSFGAAADGVDVEDVVARVVESVAPPRITPSQDWDPTHAGAGNTNGAGEHAR